MAEHIFKVVFHNLDQVFEIYARQIFQSELHGFIEIEEFLFDSKSKTIVDPGEEKLKSEFSDVKRSYIPIHSVIRIDEVESQGEPKITTTKKEGNVSTFPTGHFKPKPKP